MNISTEGELGGKTCLVVDEDDNVLCLGGLAECHERPMRLHRAFSLFVFDEQGRLLLQQRAKTKYTFPLAWTNSVCSHPRNEQRTLEEWVDLRVQDELGWTVPDIAARLVKVGKLTYEAVSDHRYGEKEIDTLFVLNVTAAEVDDMRLNPEEVEAVQWVDDERLAALAADDECLLTPWFRAIMKRVGQPFGAGLAAGATASPQPWFRVGNCAMPSADAASQVLLQAPFSYLCSNPGKGVRAELVRLYAAADGQVTPQDVAGIVSIVQRIHNASLLHDDIEDGSSTRRGAPCAHLLWGVAQTINTGTFNFLRAAQSVDDVMAHRDEPTRSAMLRRVLDRVLDLHRGQNADIVWGDLALCPTVAQYCEMIDHKTGRLFQLCADLGALCSGDAAKGEEMAAQFLQLSRFFQIRDDFANICDPQYWAGKGFYEDADEGKLSYPVLLFLNGDASAAAASKATDALAENKSQGPESEDELAGDAAWLRTTLAAQQGMTHQQKLRAYTILFDAGVLHKTRDNLLVMREAISDACEPVLKLLPLVDHIVAPADVAAHLPVVAP